MWIQSKGAGVECILIVIQNLLEEKDIYFMQVDSSNKASCFFCRFNKVGGGIHVIFEHTFFSHLSLVKYLFFFF